MHIAYDHLEREEINLVEINSFHNPVICVEIMVYVGLVYNKYKNSLICTVVFLNFRNLPVIVVACINQWHNCSFAGFLLGKSRKCK